MSKFVIQKKQKEIISLRIDSSLLHQVDLKANENDISRNELINQMILYALSNIDPSSQK